MNNIYKIIMIAIIGIITLSTMSNAIPYEEWNKTFGCDDCIAAYVEQTKDGGYLVIGSSEYVDDMGVIWDSGFIVKTNSVGNKQWEKDFSSEWHAGLLSGQQTSDGYIATGLIHASSSVPEHRAMLVKVDNSGNALWSKIYYEADVAYSVRRTSDGGYILAGETWDQQQYKVYAIIIKTDANGNKLWSKKYSEAKTVYSIMGTADGGYILAGETNWNQQTDNDAIIIKTYPNGNKLWSKKFGGINSDNAYAIRQTTNGGYIIAGQTKSFGAGNGDAWLIRTDLSGNKLWGKTFGGSTTQEIAESVIQTKDGGYIIVGNNFIIKTDVNGNILWQKTLGGAYADSVQQTRDGGYIVAGRKNSVAWLVKFSADVSVNLLKNSGFEETYSSIPRYWNKYQTGTKAIFTYPEIGRGGIGKSVAIKYLTKETGKVALWQQPGIVISPSKQYKLSGYMKLSNVTGGGTGRLNGASLRINWYRSDGGLIKVDLITKSGTSAWTKYEKILTSPPNAARATVGGDLFNSSGKVWFDDLSFTKVS